METTRDLPEDPFEVLRINDEHRRPDVNAEADLWTAAELAALGPRAYTYPVPTFAPTSWPARRIITQEEYSRRFEKEFPIAARVLRAVPENLVVAGGAAAWPFGEASAKAGDVDFFVVGIDPADEKALWAKSAEFHDALRKNIGAEDPEANHHLQSIFQLLAPGVLTLILAFREAATHDEHETTQKFQLILRAYPSVSALLHAFDVGSACVAYDGKTAKTTTLGAYAQAHRVNIVNPEYRSTTYETRLAKYFERYYAIAFPHLQRGVLRRDETLALPHMSLAPVAVRGNRAAGKVTTPVTASVSDYEPTVNQCIFLGEELVDYGVAFINLAQLASGENRFVIACSAESNHNIRFVGGYRRHFVGDYRGGNLESDDHFLPLARYAGQKEPLPRFRIEEPLLEEAGGAQRSFPVRVVAGLVTENENVELGELPPILLPAGVAWADIEDDELPPAKMAWADVKDDESESESENGNEGGPPSFTDTFPREQFRAAMDRAAESVHGSRQRIRTANLTKYLGLTAEEARVFAVKLAEVAVANPGKRVNLDGPLGHFKRRLSDRYDALAGKPIEWWITREPGRQYTASLNPCLEDPAEWYGKENLEENPAVAPREVDIESLLGALESQQLRAEDRPPALADSCTLCLEPLESGSVNSVTLPCGHIFHWSAADNGCRGLYAWIHENRDDCPVCRQNFGPGRAEARNEEPPTAEVSLVIPGWGA